MARKQTNMIKYIIKRILFMFPMLLAVLIVTFLLSQMMMADPSMSLLNIGMDELTLQRELDRLGFTDPVHIKLWKYLVNFFSGDWGVSYVVMQGTPVLDMIVKIWPKTIELVLLPIIIAPIIAVKLGVTSVKHKDKNKDIIIRFVAIIGAGFPVFFIAKVLQMVFFNLRIVTYDDINLPLMYSNSPQYLGYTTAAIVPPPPLFTLSYLAMLVFLIIGIVLVYKGAVSLKKKAMPLMEKKIKSKRTKYLIWGGSLIAICSILLIISTSFLYMYSYGTGFRIIDAILYNDQHHLWDTINHLFIPVICMVFVSLAPITRQTRSSMLDVIDQDYIRTARAKGVEEKTVLNKHALRNSLLPTSTLIIGNTTAALLGSLFIEISFNYTGLGYYMVRSVFMGDYFVIQGILVFSTIIILIGTLLTDVMYTIIDPRVSYN
ncbi:MAG: ABC transporter permease [Candidatus Lokiarchaeota archaeon]|nr:ABC transporter permease [Candidatus Lokiarchaeota archaeon]